MHLKIDTFIVMPNHVHAIVVLLDTGFVQIKTGLEHVNTGPAQRPAPTGSLPEVIRNKKSLNQIRQYIVDNPSQWARDKPNPITMM